LWTGDNRSHTWDEIHRFEVRLEELERLGEVVDDARHHAQSALGEDRLEEFEEALKRERWRLGLRRKHLALGVIREANAASAMRHEAEQQQQRGIVALASLLMLGAVITAFLQWRVFPTSPLIPRPEEKGFGLSNWATLGLVMFFGMIGGGFSALMALYVTNKTYTDTYWYDPRPALALMKISVGVWSAVVGVLGVGTGLVVGAYKSFASLVVLAFLFGYGQQLITGLIDKRVEALAAGSRPTVSPGT
jgi:hypothetical protein